MEIHMEGWKVPKTFFFFFFPSLCDLGPLFSGLPSPRLIIKRLDQVSSKVSPLAIIL